MPDKQLVYVKFDRKEIKANIQKLSLKEARRLQGPIYDVLLQELYEDGCLRTAKHFKCLVLKEVSLVQNHFTNYCVRDEPEFLLNLFENFRLAELSFKLKKAGGQLASLKILYQILLLTDRYRQQFDWLVVDIYDIVINLIKSYDDNDICFNETKMRIYYKYGSHLDMKGDRIERAIEYLRKAFDMTKGERWAPDTSPEKENYKTMYEAIPQKLATVILKHAERIFRTNPSKALDLARSAVRVLASVSWTENKYLLCKAALANAMFEVECQKYDAALISLVRISTHLVKEERVEYNRLRCEVFWYKGFCLYSLNQEERAMESLRIAYEFAHKFKIRDLKAEILLTIGRTYGKNPKHINKAIEAYTSARRIFVLLDDNNNKMKTTYLMAKLKADQLFPLFLNLIKTDDYCKYYTLRKWKNQIQPFWQEAVRASVDDSIRIAIAQQRSVESHMAEKEESVSTNESEEPEPDILREHFFEIIDNFPRFHWDEKKQIDLLNRPRGLECLLDEFAHRS